MYVETVPNRSSPPAILLRESWREDGKVHKRTLLNLTHWDPAHVEGLRAVLKGGTVIPPGQDAIRIARSLPHGQSLPCSAPRAGSVSTRCSAPRATAAATWCWRCSSAGSLILPPSSPPRGGCRPTPPPPASARCSASARLTRTSSTPP